MFAGTRLERATAALVEMGSCVVTGITITKLVGVMVLNWAPSVLFRLYYFRMYAGIIACGAFHGLAFLPVLLSFVGPESAVKRVEYFDLMDPLLSKNADPMDYSSLNGDKSSGEKIVSGITQPLLAEDDRIR